MTIFNIPSHLYIAAVDLDTSTLPNHDANKDAAASMWTVGLQIVFGTIGAVALLIIVISGLRYVVASGDPQKTAEAKKSILYALIGLAIALAALSIVTLVVKGVG